jgi:aspartate aminotransferase-like enzyme
MTNSASAPLAPSDRLLCGPDPTNADPVALAAMDKPMLGHVDPEMLEILAKVVRTLRLVYRNPEGLVLALQATGRTPWRRGSSASPSPATPSSSAPRATAVQDELLAEHGIEVGGGLPGASAMWRTGLMGPNATTATAGRVFDALVTVLETQGAPVST